LFFGRLARPLLGGFAHPGLTVFRNFVIVVILRLNFKRDTIGHDVGSVIEDEHFGFLKFLANHLTLLDGFWHLLKGTNVMVVKNKSC
jgi:hypothetical protein